jgi:hypothetical protein
MRLNRANICKRVLMGCCEQKHMSLASCVSSRMVWVELTKFLTQLSTLFSTRQYHYGTQEEGRSD